MSVLKASVQVLSFAGRRLQRSATSHNGSNNNSHQPEKPLSLSLAIPKSNGKIVPYNVGAQIMDSNDTGLDGETKVKFCLKFRAEFGQRIRVVGSCSSLGNWDMPSSPELQWSAGHLWQVTIHLPRGTVHEYKFVICHSDGYTAAAWQQGNNAVLAILVRAYPC